MKNSIKILLLVITCFGLPVSLFAQKTSSNAETEWSQLDQLGIVNDDATIPPLGNNDQDRFQVQPREIVIIDQVNGSQITIEQKGKDNSTEWFHAGYNNTFDLEQHGNENTHDGILVGDENYIRVEQYGNGNRVSQDLAGNRMDLDVIQHGNNHELIQVEKDGTSPAYQIHQQGEYGMKVIIEHERH